MPSARRLSDQLAVSLQSLYDEAEARAIARVAGEEMFGREAMRADGIVREADMEKWQLLIDRLQQGMPLQYALERAWFMDLTLRVTPDVLIPRPETEELVELVISRNKLAAPRILDIGTGSGCIAIALKKHIPEAKVSACDIAPAVLAVASENAALNGISADFFIMDILDEKAQPPDAPYQILISNPPYIDPADAPLMHANVVQFEPHLALFADGDDPFIFYRKIAGFAQKYVQGEIWLEISADTGTTVADIFRASGATQLEIITDMQGKERLVTGKFA